MGVAGVEQWTRAAARALDRVPPQVRARTREVMLRVPAVAWANDVRHLSARYEAYYGVPPDLRRPRHFSEKLFHSMAFDRNPLRFRAADKLAARSLVAERIGAEHLVPLIGVYERPDQIPWDDLPPRFMAKPNHGSGWFHAVHDLASESRDELTTLFEHWLSMDYYPFQREAIYRGIPRRIMLEQLLQPSEGPLYDYRFWTFHQRLALVVCEVRQEGPLRITRYYPDLTIDDRVEFPYGSVGEWPLDPDRTERLLAMALANAEGFDFARIDFFVVDGQIFAGEITSYPAAGMVLEMSRPFLDEAFRGWVPRRPDWRYLLGGDPRRAW